MKKEEKGITLIALVITIIVMLILVGVTINVAINGGLFNQAQKVANDTKIAAEYESLIGIVLGNMKNNGKIDGQGLKINLETAGFTILEENETELVIQTPLEQEYKIDLMTGNITVQRDDLEYLRKILVENKPDLFTMVGEDGNINLPDNEKMIMMGSSGNKYPIAKYNNKYFVLEIKMEMINMQEGKVFCTSINQEKINKYEGKYVKYDSNADSMEEMWIILHNDSNTGLQIMSLEGSNEFTLKKDYSSTGIQLIKDRLADYNYLVENLNTFCNDIIKDTDYKEFARCLGSNPTNPNKTNTNLITTSDISSKWFADNYDGLIRKGDNGENSLKDMVKMISLGVELEQGGAMADRQVEIHDNSIIISFSYSNGTGGSFYTLSSNPVYNGADVRKVYPVVKLKSNVSIDTSSGDGSKSSPYSLSM